MPITVAHRNQLNDLAKDRPRARVIDVTSHGKEPFVRLSPFFPHGGIPVPGAPDNVSESVEGVWQALKVFEHADVDTTKLAITTLTDIKRRGFRHGRILGHRETLEGGKLLDYETARRRIYLPTYRYVLDQHVAGLIRLLRVEASRSDVILLDYTTNGEVADLSAPLSHAALVAMYVKHEWPSEG